MKNYVAVDLEMTGLHPRKDRILEIGGIKVEEGIAVDQFHRLVNPWMEISPEITELTGITNEMVKEGCEAEKAVTEFREFAEGFPLIGHNILFDYSFLKQYSVNYGYSFEKEGVDTLKLARKFLPEAEKKTLDYLCGYLQIPRKKNHRALEDAEAAGLLFRRLQGQFAAADPEAFLPKPLQYKVKKQGPASPRQKRKLKELAEWHNIELKVEIDSLTRNEVSRLTDKILSAYGRIPGRNTV
ncbi:MAG: 3'-5' exonuclease [Lachnospiraceae bacterium]|nr:3'-5' exonuclease [Lachnospiraceae bacterium]